jgi:acetolactate synthase-1/2/3 large subunit
MNLQELATAMEYKLPVKIAIINNGYHGMVRQWQDLFYNGRYASSYLGTYPDYVKLAAAYDCIGLRATKPDEVQSVIKEGLKSDRPVLMDFHTDPQENCYPMIPAGGANHEMITEDPPELKKKGAKPSEGEKEGVLTA